MLVAIYIVVTVTFIQWPTTESASWGHGNADDISCRVQAQACGESASLQLPPIGYGISRVAHPLRKRCCRRGEGAAQ